ncbi:MAG: hypothetical protein K1W24_12995 [Lachnospiraceae bacterium]
MKEIALEIPICIIAAALIMVIHELIKSIVYLFVRKVQRQAVSHNSSIFAVWKYIDPLGLLLSATCFVPVSKPHLFRIRDKKTNMVLGITGFMVLLSVFFLSIAVLKTGCLGMAGFFKAGGSTARVVSIFWQYMAILSFDMFIANMFPVSTFDMGLVIAGFSAKHYLHIIKADSIIKLIFILALMFDIIHYGCIKLLRLIL